MKAIAQGDVFPIVSAFDGAYAFVNLTVGNVDVCVEEFLGGEEASLVDHAM